MFFLRDMDLKSVSYSGLKAMGHFRAFFAYLELKAPAQLYIT